MIETKDIVSAFFRIEQELIRSMIRNLKKHRVDEIAEGKEWSMWQVEQLHSLDTYRRSNLKKYSKKFDKLNKQIEQAIEQSYRDAEQEHIALAEGAGLDTRFFSDPTDRLDALIKATHDDMLTAEHSVLRKADDMYRSTIFDAVVYAQSGAVTYEQAIDMATKDFLAKGIKSIAYRSKKTGEIVGYHGMREYSQMAIRTATKRAYLVAQGEQRKAWGVHTVFVDYRETACPKCIVWAGEILVDDVYSGGTQEEALENGYRTLSEAMEEGLFHPNCKDTLSTYFPGITPKPRSLNNDEIADSEYIYELEQMRNEAKAKARGYHSLAENSLDKKNVEKYEAKDKEWTERADAAEDALKSAEVRTAIQEGIESYEPSQGIDGGFTIDLNAKKAYKLGESDGFAVGGFGTELIIEPEIWQDKRKLKKALNGFVAENYDLLSQDGYCLGGWIPSDEGELTNKLVLDVSRVSQDRWEAAVWAAERGENSITDFAGFDWLNTEDLAKEYDSVDLSYQGENTGSGRAYSKNDVSIDYDIDALDKFFDKYPRVKETTPQEVFEQIEAIRKGKQTVTIYRATSGVSINNGDWVFLSYDEADSWARSKFTKELRPGYKVLREEVPVEYVQWTGKNAEFVKTGQPSLLERYQKAHAEKEAERDGQAVVDIVNKYEQIDASDAIDEIEKGGTNSLEMYLVDGTITQERRKVHDDIIDDLLNDKTPPDGQPIMTMLGGGPASGKSSVMNSDTSKDAHTVTVDPDDMKKRLPGFAERAKVDEKAASYYHEESSALAKRFSEVAYGEGLNVIYDGTGDGTIKSVEKKINAAREKGYRVEAKYVTIDTDEAVRRNKKRYDDAIARGETPRLPPEQYVRDTHAKVTDISVATAPLFDHIEVWDNNGAIGEQVLIAEGGSGKYLRPIKGQEDKFLKYLAKGTQGLDGFVKLSDGSYRPKE